MQENGSTFITTGEKKWAAAYISQLDKIRNMTQ